MAIVQSLGALATVNDAWYPSLSYGTLSMYNGYSYDYATMYKTQPNVRTCIDFLGRNIAQLGLHWFRRVSETDRQRLRDHAIVQTMDNPLPPEYKVTRYRLIESTVEDLGIYYNAYWLKVQTAGQPAGLLRLPPTAVTVYGELWPTGYEVTVNGKTFAPKPSEIVHFRGYNAESASTGLSPLETLRRILAEEHAAGNYREKYWANSARMAGIISRPADAPEWSDTARGRFKAEFESLYAGEDNSGKTAILEEGMTWQQATYNAQESEYLAGRKLTREECARAYHIPLPMVGILDHATFSNIKEQHKQLYQDCLGPWLAMLEQEIMLQLLPDFDDTEGVYCEFNIAEKLAGSFEEQTQSLQASVGRPWMAPDEARARFNLPAMGGDAGKLGTPLNVLIGGQASPQDSAAPETRSLEVIGAKAARGVDPTLPRVRERHRAKWAEALAAYFRRQEAAMVGRVPEKSAKAAIEDVWRDGKRWNRELAQDLFKLAAATAGVFAGYVADQAGGKVDPALMEPYLEETTRIAAEGINDTTRAEIAAAMASQDPDGPRAAVRHIFEIAATTRALQIATTSVSRAASFGSNEGARASGLRGKRWQVNSSNPRDSHAALNGETVGIGERFSNGLLWPGDPSGGAGADEIAGCECTVIFVR